MKTLIGIIIVLMSFAIQAQNAMYVVDTECTRWETVSIPINVANQDDFVAFQFDLVIPVSTTFVSAELTDRSDGHMLSAVAVEPTRVRVLAFSMSNALFKDNEGPIVKIHIEVEARPGIHPLLLEDAIIASPSAQNIIDDYCSGILTVKRSTVSIKSIVEPEGFGIVEGYGDYEIGYPVKLLAIPYRSTEFVKWSIYGGEVISKEEYLVFRAEKDEIFVAHFKKKSPDRLIDRIRLWWRNIRN